MFLRDSGLLSIDAWLRRRSTWTLLASCAGVVALIGYIDDVTSEEITLSAAYAGPILVYSWYGTRNTALLLSAFATLVWWWANRSTNPFHSDFGYPIATLNRIAYYSFFAVGGAALRARHEADRARIKALERGRQLEREILRVSEFEQQRIGQDLHDGLCQYLAAIGCAAGSLADDLTRRGVHESSDAREIEILIHKAISQARDLARGIFPVQMDGAGLGAALQELAQTTQRLTSALVTFEEVGEIDISDPNVAMQLYRIAQEALSNALRHGGAKLIRLTLQQDGEKVRLAIDDDGSGIAPTLSANEGMGLRTMEYRARLLQGELHIGGSSLGGASIQCHTRLRFTPKLAA